ncbi:AAA family ATPase [Wenzhouxiangella sp. XN79A]|uniref:AAA family ATPase n=1 Tax=Wenzhouxiangella sp. XN79A TaxID=2724193 RepID=UPI00144ABBF0|nr:AAA family ATPase [Wenzhouxiangella sp. XN79A]NKI35125.1 AAA family ATPase [Wenzhouxiangella sp. XN79A]
MSDFRLPEWQELSRDEQIPIINLPTDKTYFVRGGPGTGKSILAIHRVARLRDLEPDTPVKLLVYNKPLQLHLDDALNAVGLGSGTAQTCHSWLWHMTRFKPPSNVWNYDWKRVREIIDKKANGNKIIGHLIIDECQDVPAPLLEILATCSENATIFVDDKQAISASAREHGLCQLAEIRTIFDQGPNRTFDLSRNFRNSQPILDAAHALRPPQTYEIPDNAIRKEGPKPSLRRADIDEVVERVETYHANNPADRIAIAVPRSRSRALLGKLEASEVPTQFYSNKNANDGTYSATAKGATVLAHDMMKGLEFDAVFMPFLETPELHAETDPELVETNQNLVYVVATRARSYLEFSHSEDLPTSWLTRALERACSEGQIRRASD